MKKAWFLAFGVVIVVLLLLQGYYSEFYKIDEAGYAVKAQSISALLYTNPEEKVDDDRVSLYSFKESDIIFSNGSSYFMGKDDKTQIDLVYPLYINGGAGIRFINDSGTLFDEEFSEVEVYDKLSVVDGITYNPGGERADAVSFYFYRTSNSFFYNLTNFSYNNGKQDREIAPNSIINFNEEYMAYLEWDNGELQYNVCNNIPADATVKIGENEMTYSDLLLSLGVKRIPTNNTSKKDKIEDIALEQLDESASSAINVIQKPKKKKQTEDEEKTKNETDSSNKLNSTLPTVESDDDNNQNTSNKKPLRDFVNRGDRPESERPPRPGEEEPDNKDEVEYVQPTVTFNGVTNGVYRIMTDISVSDPASRITSSKVQLFFYEQNSDGTESLSARYATGSSKIVTAGEGIIKPGTKYRVYASYSYLDEKGKKVDVDLTGNECFVTTDDIDTIGKVVFKQGYDGVIDYQSIPCYYDNYLELCNLARDKDSTDEEALYGIHSTTGFTLTMTEKDGSKSYTSKVTPLIISKIKKGEVVTVDSSAILKPATKYSYIIKATDFFGNEIVLENNTGEFETSKGRPDGSVRITVNELENIKIQATLLDNYNTMVKTNGEYNTQIVILTKKIENYTNEELAAEIEAYKNNGNKKTETSTLHYYYKFKEDEYTENNGLISIDSISQKIDSHLGLNIRYYAYLLTDFDLNNKKGVVNNGQVGYIAFTSASLASLGDVYLSASFKKITQDSVDIDFAIRGNTNSTLKGLLKSVDFKVVVEGYPAPDGNGTITKEFGNISLADNLSAFKSGTTVTKSLDNLESMYEYKIIPTVYASYNGEDQQIDVQMDQDTFRLTKRPATVEVKNLINAAGNLVFDIRIEDLDQAIVGENKDTVLMKVYDYKHNLVYSERIFKNTVNEEGKPEFVHERITGLQPGEKFFFYVIADEYNEGYTNLTKENGKYLATIYADEPIDLSGTIKLQEITRGTTEDTLTAKVQVHMWDNSNALSGKPYQLKLYCDGEDITDSLPAADQNVSYSYIPDAEGRNTKEIKKDHSLKVLKGNHEYKVVLSVVLWENYLEVDSLEFTTEEEVVGIKNAFEFAKYIQANPNGKFCILDDIDMGNLYDEIISQEWNEETQSYIEVSTGKYELSKLVDPENPTSGEIYNKYGMIETFNGKIDFQGYKFKYNKNLRSTSSTYKAPLFTTLGPDAEIYNAVFEFKAQGQTAAMNYTAFFTYRNYGYIHDIIFNYLGGELKSNYAYGLLCYTNSGSGVIEDFIIHNAPEEGLQPFCVRQYGGMLMYVNYGTVRNGYLYGEDIIAATEKTTVGGHTYVGGMIGNVTSGGKAYNLYSLSNIKIGNPKDSSSGTKTDDYYGSIVGYANGSEHNMYAIGQNTYRYTYDGDDVDYDKDSICVVVGRTSTYHKKIYYWNENNFTYSKTKVQKRISGSSLKNATWHRETLGNHFDCSVVDVGYFPRLKLSSELQGQEYIELPNITISEKLEVVSSDVLEYSEDGKSARVQLRINNPSNFTITGIDIDYLKTVIDRDSIEFESGLTTLEITVSEPQKYYSEYPVKEIKYIKNGKENSDTAEDNTVIYVDFYRDISSADDWYNYVVLKSDENAKLTKDIDFKGIAPKRIRVNEFTGKLDGGANSETEKGYSIKNINMSYTPANPYVHVISKLTGEVNNLCVDNLTINSNKSNQNTVGFIGVCYGRVSNVHMTNVDITGCNYVGGLVARGYDGVNIENCSITQLKINYIEPKNVSTTGSVGGIIGGMVNSHIRSCYVAKADIQVGDIMAANGVGGIIGYASGVRVDGVYATGSISSRCQNVGGAIGYYTSDAEGTVLKNIIAKVNVNGSQDNLGGIVGAVNLTSALLDKRNNVSGIAFGNVVCSNSQLDTVSCTIGSFATVNECGFYGTDTQLLNGVSVGTDGFIDYSTLGFLSQQQALEPYEYIREDGLSMDAAYDFSYVSSGFLPHLCYSSDLGYSTIELPNQTNIPMTGADDIEIPSEIQIKSIFANTTGKRIIMDIIGPANAEITNIEIEDFVIESFGNDGEKTYIGSDGNLRLVIFYKDNSQEHFKDAYKLNNISYKNNSGKEVTVDFSSRAIEVPIQLFMDIPDIETWNRATSSERNYGNYENYRITNSIDFGTGADYNKNAKIGRLNGIDNTITLEGINLTGNDNWIFRLNSEMKYLNFKNCSVKDPTKSYSGLIGTSCASIQGVTFENITITGTNRSYLSIIACQVGGRIDLRTSDNRIVLSNIKVGEDNKKNSYLGGLVGITKGGAILENINAKDIEVRGTSYYGGLVGYSESKTSYGNITLTDIKVLGSTEITNVVDCYAGGLVGRNYTPNVGGVKGGYMTNIKILGTRNGDESTTVIAPKTKGPDANARYVGGISGSSTCYNVGFIGTFPTSDAYISEDGIPLTNANAKESMLIVDGIVVKNCGYYTGGAFGASNRNANIYVHDIYMGMSSEPTTPVHYLGGVTGYSSYQVQYCCVKECEFDLVNYGNAGCVAGYVNTSGVNYCTSKNNSLKVKTTTKLNYYGGIIGRNQTSLSYCDSINNVIDITSENNGEACNVGGISGYAQGTIQFCYSYGQPATADVAVSDSKYYVSGDTYVGGIVGTQNANGVQYCYSNINVKAKVKYAGGIDGRYNNSYTKTNGTYTYSGAYLRNNYFAGSVWAKDCAGGLVGSNALVEDHKDEIQSNLDKNISGRFNSTSGGMKKTGSSNERAYTYSNILVASSISSDGEAYAFCGNIDGFEGKANGYNSYSSVTLDTSDANTKYNADCNKASEGTATKTMMWEGTLLKGTPLYYMTTDAAKYHGRIAGPDTRGNASTVTGYRYLLLNGGYDDYKPGEPDGGQVALGRSCFGDFNEFESQSNFGVRLVSSSQLSYGRAYHSVGFTNVNTKEHFMYMNGYGFSILAGGVKNSGDCSPYFGTANVINNIYAGESARLPHIRANTNSGTSNWSHNYYINRKQVYENVFLKIPKYDRGSAYQQLGASSADLSVAKIIMYSTDADKVNVEFSSDFVNAVSATITVGDKEVMSNEMISQPVYTFEYDHKDNITVKYKDIDGNDVKKTYKPEQLENHVMVYGNKYYYIDEGDVICGVANESGEMEESTCISGDIISLVNGNAIDSSGNVYSVESGEVIRTVSETKLLDEIIPLTQCYLDGSLMQTYGLHTYIQSGTTIVRNQQIVVGYDGTVGIFNTSLDTVRDSINLYKKDDKEYCTVLGMDGIMIDLYQGEDFNTPEDMSVAGIVYMTSNYNASEPYVLVEYSDGGIYGYNYMTGEMICDHQKEKDTSLFAYASEYFRNETSSLERAYVSYAGATDTIKKAGGTVEGLEKIVGNNNGRSTTGNSTGNGYKTDDSTVQDKAEDDGTPTGDETEVRDTEAQEIAEEIENSEDGEEKDTDYEAGNKYNGSSNEEGSNLDNGDATATDEAKTDIPSFETDGDLLVAYNEDTDTYDILGQEFLENSPYYESENERLGVVDLSDYSSFFAESDKEKDVKGVWMYILVMLGAVGCLGGARAFFKKQSKNTK